MLRAGRVYWSSLSYVRNSLVPPAFACSLNWHIGRRKLTFIIDEVTVWAKLNSDSRCIKDLHAGIRVIKEYQRSAKNTFTWAHLVPTLCSLCSFSKDMNEIQMFLGAWVTFPKARKRCLSTLSHFSTSLYYPQAQGSLLSLCWTGKAFFFLAF